MGRFMGWLLYERLHHLIIWPYLNCLNGFGVLRYVEIIPKRARRDQFFWIVMWTGPCEPTVRASFQSQKGLKILCLRQALKLHIVNWETVSPVIFSLFLWGNFILGANEPKPRCIKSQRSISTPAEKSTQAAQMPPPLEYEVSTTYVSYGMG